MKIAMPYMEGKVNAHFGSSQQFVIIEMEGSKVTGKKILTNETLHDHGGLAQMLKNEKVGVVIAGGIGMPMANALQKTGLEVITGAQGDVEKVAEDYVNGRLVTSRTMCNCGGHH